MQLKDIKNTRLAKILIHKYSSPKVTIFDFIFLLPFVVVLFMGLLFADILKSFPYSPIFFITLVSCSIFIKRCKVIIRK